MLGFYSFFIKTFFVIIYFAKFVPSLSPELTDEGQNLSPEGQKSVPRQNFER